MTIRQIKEGEGISFKIMLADKPVEFNLTLIATQNFRNEAFDRYEFGFIDKTYTRYIRSPYTGGNTGFGKSGSDMKSITPEWSKSYKIITQDIDTINEYALAIEQEEQAERSSHELSMNSRVKSINNLPTTFKTGNKHLDTICRFTRGKAEYRPSYSRNIIGAYVSLEKKVITGRSSYRDTFTLERYISKDRKFLIKKFATESKWFFGSVALMFDPKELLTLLFKREHEINTIIKECK